MLTIQKTLSLSPTYPLEHFGKQEDILFFDIETTGFSGDSSQLYLIGCAYYEEQSWHLIQWFSDTAQSELELLHAFFHFLERFDILIHFNGNRFDIPYLLKRCAYYRLPYDFTGICKQIDIYQRIHPYKKLLGCSNLKQKTIESFLGIERNDCFHGGELIKVYQNYLHTKDSELLHLLLLHNAEDLQGMLSILPILHYSDFLESDFSIISQSTDSQSSSLLTLQVKGTCSIPKPFSAVCPIATVFAENNQLTLVLPLFTGTLKYFYPDYKNYYYLPAEDRAIHKSIGEFVDKSARQKATSNTCYQKSYGTFLPQLSPILQPVFQEHKKASVLYTPYTPSVLNDNDLCNHFVHHILCLAESIPPLDSSDIVQETSPLPFEKHPQSSFHH